MHPESPEQIEARTKHLLVWYELAEKYLFPAPESSNGLASRLHILLNLGAAPQESDSAEGIEYRLRLKIAEELRAQTLQALARADGEFLGRLAKACQLAKQKIDQPLTATGAALYAFRELSEELNHRPSRAEVRARVEEWFSEGGLPRPSDRQWQRVSRLLGPLFRGVSN